MCKIIPLGSVKYIKAYVFIVILIRHQMQNKSISIQTIFVNQHLHCLVPNIMHIPSNGSLSRVDFKMGLFIFLALPVPKIYAFEVQKLGYFLQDSFRLGPPIIKLSLIVISIYTKKLNEAILKSGQPEAKRAKLFF